MDEGPSIKAVRSAIQRWSANKELNKNGWTDALRFLDYKPSTSAGKEHLDTSLDRIRKLMASSAKGCDVAARIVLAESKDKESAPQRITQFHLLLILTTTRAALSATAQALDPKSEKKFGEWQRSDPVVPKMEDYRECLQALADAKVQYVIGVPPLDRSDPFLGSFKRWLVISLAACGVASYQANWVADQVVQGAQQKFRTHLMGTSRSAVLMRDYLALKGPRKTEVGSQEGIPALEEPLKDWISAATLAVNARQEAWAGYRDYLEKLPDQSETMFNETFGVRSVFQPPIIAYHVNGREHAHGEPDLVEDVGLLLGGLISDRISGEDLIILSGGPGSGKSTFCRVLASQLATMPEMHPVFLRLRRAKEGTDITAFIEESMQRRGLIDRLSDLRQLSNLVLILDGFDELAMSSKARLRQFFNILHDELSHGPLRDAKVIVSGRDTLFPRGEGMPPGSHVLTLRPFDRERVRMWGEMWRKRHGSGQGAGFFPERLLSTEDSPTKEFPLAHLVTWPLTLHLLAQIHTAGRFDISSTEGVLEKAYLYRAILFETAERQVQQAAEGKGRLDPARMRKFLRELAWEMFLRSVDSMEPVDVGPILASFYPDATESDLSELADVAIVNMPELTRGEETGFEFVHKSFSEFLVAERIADILERVSFKAPDYGVDEETWRMSDDEAASILSTAIAIRPLPAEVQEMLEPMLGGLAEFLSGNRVDDVVAPAVRREGLDRLVERLEQLYWGAARGKAIHVVAQKTRDRVASDNTLETYANYCIGLVLIGSAAARRTHGLIPPPQVGRLFHCESQYGVFWRFLAIIQAGGITLDYAFGRRLFDGATVRIGVGEKQVTVSEQNLPVKFFVFDTLDGFNVHTADLAEQAVLEAIVLDAVWSALPWLIQSFSPEDGSIHQRYRMRIFDPRDRAVSRLARMLAILGLADDRAVTEFEYRSRDLLERIVHEFEIRERDSYNDPRDVLGRIYDLMLRLGRGTDRGESTYYLERYIRTQFENLLEAVELRRPQDLGRIPRIRPPD